MPAPQHSMLRQTLRAVAPGTELRDGLERILRGRTGALIVLGYDDVVASICSGGFDLDVEFSATGLRELAKMDGAVIVDFPQQRIRRANVQLMPDTSVETSESGMRHRTAERVSKQTGYPVITVSQSMRTVALYVDHQRHVVEDSNTVLSRANQALATLERYRARLDEVSGTLSALEIEDLVTVREVATVVQRLEMVSRIVEEIDGYVVELGADGRLLALQIDELIGGLDPQRELIIRDYTSRPDLPVHEMLDRLAVLTDTELIELSTIARSLSIGTTAGESLDEQLTPRGYRMLSQIPRLPAAVVTQLAEHSGSLQWLLAASTADLQEVGGVGPQRAQSVREGLSRLAERSILERYS